jgi:hypothetical protein
VAPATATFRARGLRTAGTSGSAEGDGLLVAENVVLDRDRLIGIRRGVARYGTALTGKTLDTIGSFGDLVLLRATDGTVYLWDLDGASAPTPIAGTYHDPDDGRFSFSTSALSLFLAHAGGVTRLDASDGTPEPAGMPGGTDAAASFYTDVGTILAIGSMVRTGGALVTVTLVNHGLTTGDDVVLSEGEADFAAGTFQVTVIGDNSFSYAQAGADVSSTSENTLLRAGDGKAMPGDCQVAYRVLFGKEDSHGRLILGAPSGRGLLTSAFITSATGGVTHPAGGGGSVIVTVNTDIAHGFTTGEWVVCTFPVADQATLTDGVYPVTVVDTNTFTVDDHTNPGAGGFVSTGESSFERAARNVTVLAGVPAGLPEGAFFQVYRSPSTVSFDVSPSDEMFLAY